MRNLPVWLSGADAEVLARFPGDRARYTTQRPSSDPVRAGLGPGNHHD